MAPRPLKVNDTGDDVLAFQQALKKAYAEAANGVLERIARRLAAMPVPANASGGTGSIVDA